MDIGRALLESDPGQERAVCARMLTSHHAIRARVRRLMVQAAEHLNQALDRLQRLKAAAQLEFRSLTLRPPGGGNGAVGDVDEGRTQRGARRGRAQPAAGQRARGEPGCRAQ